MIPGNELLHAFHAVFDQRIVLAIGRNGVKPERVFDLTLEQSPFVEGDDDVFVGLGHGVSPLSSAPRLSVTPAASTPRRRSPAFARACQSRQRSRWRPR